MISGLPGAGKSTIALQVAEAFDARGTLYISEEMPLELLRSYRDRVAPTIENMTAWHAPDFQDVLEYLAEKRPALVVLDSLQRVGEEESASLKELLRVCGQMQSAILVLCHATKAGDFAGLLASQHDVDISLWVRRDEEGAFVQTVKNRHGPAPLETKL